MIKDLLEILERQWKQGTPAGIPLIASVTLGDSWNEKCNETTLAEVGTLTIWGRSTFGTDVNVDIILSHVINCL